MPVPQELCGTVQNDTDYFGGDIANVNAASPAECCKACLMNTECKYYTFWEHEAKCGLKSAANATANTDRVSGAVHRKPLSAAELCATNAGVLAVLNSSIGGIGDHVDLIIYNHAAWADPIVTCSITVTMSQGTLAGATIRRIDETHANPLRAWVEMGAPDYTTQQQNAQILLASQLHALPFAEDDGVSAKQVHSSAPPVITVVVPPHGIAAVRLPL